MNEKCSLDNLSRYLRVIGLLSLIIILIIVVYYYLQSNRSKILEKYESYALRECKVYFTEGDTNIKNCDITQETSNYTGTCSYRFDGWNEFDTYTDNDGKTITYPKKVYTQTRTNTNDFNNPMFTNNCFKAYTDETCLSNTPNDNCIPPEFEYNANNVVRYDEPGTSGNTAVGTNIYGGLRYSSMQFLNTADARYNNTNLISSICDVAPNDALGSLKDKVFYMFEFNGTTNKLENIRSVALDSNQTTFSPVSSDNVLTNLPPRPTDASFYGIQYDATNRNLPIKIFKKNNIPRNVAVFKFNYMSYICTNSQIKNYMRANRIIIPEKFIKYGSSTTPNYSKNISIGNMTIKKDWKWSDYSSADFNVDYSDKLKYDLNTSIDERKAIIDASYAGAKATADTNHKTALGAYNNANSNKDNFSTNKPTFSSLIGMQKQNSATIMFDYMAGYNVNNVKEFPLPTGEVLNDINNSTDKYMVFNFTSTTPGLPGQTQYTLNVPSNYTADILVIGGGGGGGRRHGAGGGSGTLLYHKNINLNGTYTIKVGEGGPGAVFKDIAALRGADSQFIKNDGSQEYFAVGGGLGTDGGKNYAITSGGQGFMYNPSLTLSSENKFNGVAVVVSNKQYVNTLTSPEGCRGNIGGTQITNFKGGGGGGAGSAGMNHDAETTINDGYGGLGLSVDITGSAVVYAGGGNGSDFNGSVSQVFNPSYPTIQSRGGGGFGSDNGTPENGLNGTGGGGGGQGNDIAANGGRGGNGVVIVRFKITNSFSSYSFGALQIDNTNSANANITNIITLTKKTIQENILSSFIFLQKGTYIFRAGVEGASYNNNILSSELIIYETSIVNSLIFINNPQIGYRYTDNKGTSFSIDIQQGKFYKLAFRYIYFNFTNYNMDLSFKIYNQNIDLTNYLFGGTNINRDYVNRNIMTLFSNITYIGNDRTTYASIIDYLNDPNGIDFFNIKKFYNDEATARDYKDRILPNEIEDTKRKDTAIINMNTIIGYINNLKGNNANVNYGSHLPTTSPSIYKDITIDEIFGKNFDRLITKDKVKDYNALFNANLNTRAPPTKKIYVEAVAA